MGLIEEVKKLKEQGLSDAEIINVLREKGKSPIEIHDALEQAKIKEAIASGKKQEVSEEMKPSIMEKPSEEIRPFGTGESEEQQQPQTIQEMSEKQPTPSIPTPPVPEQETAKSETQVMEQPEVPQAAPPAETLQPVTQETIPAQTTTQAPAISPPEAMPSQETITQPESYVQGTEGEAYGYGYAEPDYSMINEIVSQIVDEKIEKINEKFSSLEDFKVRTETKIKAIEKKLDRLNTLVDALQVAVLRRVGDYINDVKEIKQELEAMQESFAKILNPLEESIRELKRIAEEKAKE